jgi:excisionase family DNA binding protein
MTTRRLKSRSAGVPQLSSRSAAHQGHADLGSVWLSEASEWPSLLHTCRYTTKQGPPLSGGYEAAQPAPQRFSEGARTGRVSFDAQPTSKGAEVTVIPFEAGRSPFNSADILLTIEEAAQWLKIGRTLMYELVRTGDVESVTIGRLRRIPFECLTEYVARLRAHVVHKQPAA